MFPVSRIQMSSCITPVPYAFAAGGVCAGFGTCVNSLRNSQLLLCKCQPGHSGASDFFDNRVERLPDGTWLSFSCNESDVGKYIMWSLFTMMAFVRLYQLGPIWYQFYKKHYADETRIMEGIWKDPPLRILTFDFFGLSICYLITGISKLFGLTFGTNSLPTLGLCFGVLFYQIIIFDLSRTEMDIFVHGSASPAKAAKIKRLRLTYKCLGLLLSFLLNTIPTILTLFTDKSLGPLFDGGNLEELAIYPRNIGSIAFGLGELWSAWLIRRRVAKLPDVGGANTAAAVIIQKMDAELKQYIIYLLTLGIAYAVFTIPYLLPYQTYLISYIVGLGALRHSGKSFTHDKELKARGISVAEPVSRSKPTPRSKSKESTERTSIVIFPKLDSSSSPSSTTDINISDLAKPSAVSMGSNFSD